MVLVNVIVLRFFLSALAFISVVIGGWLVMFDGLTLISNRLSGPSKQHFNIIVAIAVPLVASLYFLKETSTFTFLGVFGAVLTPYVLIPVVFISAISWAAADQMDRENPIRGFLIAATILWVLSASVYYGVNFTNDDDDYGSSYSESDNTLDPKQTGRAFGQYVTYVAISYGAMIAKLRQNERA